MEDIVKNEYTIKTKSFEGPFDLLFHIIEKNNLKVYDISISEITDQYMEYLFSMQELDLDIASEFVVMAATLLHIKSRLLLPEKKETEEDTEDPKEELILRLVEYKKYKDMANVLRDRELEWSKVFYKMPEIIRGEVQNQELDLSSYNLKLIYENLISKKVQRTNRRTGEISQIIQREKFSVKNKIREIMRNLKTKPILKFSQIYSIKNRTVPEVITGFLAMLELTRLKRITIKQKAQFADITILKTKNSSNVKELSTIYNSMEEL